MQVTLPEALAELPDTPAVPEARVSRRRPGTLRTARRKRGGRLARRPPPAGLPRWVAQEASPTTPCHASGHHPALEASDALFITNVSFDSHAMYVRLAPSHEIAVPFERLPTVAAMTPDERHCWELVDHARGLRWPRHDLTLPLAALLPGTHESGVLGH